MSARAVERSDERASRPSPRRRLECQIGSREERKKGQRNEQGDKDAIMHSCSYMLPWSGVA